MAPPIGPPHHIAMDAYTQGGPARQRRQRNPLHPSSSAHDPTHTSTRTTPDRHPTSTRTALRLQDVKAGYPGHPPLLAHVDLELVPGEVVGIVGVSGTGKTTLLKTISGILPPRHGTVEILGHKAPNRPPRGSIGYIPQRLGLVAHATVLDNVLMGALHREPSWRSALRLPSRKTLRETHEALERVGLASKQDEPVKELSGGQQRRVAVARALLQRPRLLLADEFLSELDRATAAIVEDAVLELADRYKTAIVLVEHHIRKARAMADRVYEVHAGLFEPLPAKLPGATEENTAYKPQVVGTV